MLQKPKFLKWSFIINFIKKLKIFFIIYFLIKSNIISIKLYFKLFFIYKIDF